MSGRQSLLRLPNELLESILFFAPDGIALAGLALSCRHMYDIFKRNEDNIVNTVLTACISVNVLPEALLALRCKPPSLNTDLVDWSAEQIAAQTDYAAKFSRNMREAGKPRSRYTTGTVFALCDFHVHVVRPLQERFIASRTDPWSNLNFPQLLQNLNERPLSQPEKERIWRSLYRFEIYRKLYGCSSKCPHSFADRSEDFFLQYTGWELAQLGCIHDFLAHEILPIFRNVAEQDIAWGKSKVKYGGGVQDSGIQQLLATGLKSILQLTELRTQPWEVQAAALTATWAPLKCKPFLSGELSKLHDNVAKAAWRSSHSDSSLFSWNPFCQDGDHGPKKMWLRESTRYGTNSGLYHSVYDPHGSAARSWGHVFWDHERHLLLFPPETWNRHWRHGGKASSLRKCLWVDLVPADAKAWDVGVTKKEMKSSWKTRKKLYKTGFRGKWEDALNILQVCGSPRTVDKACTGWIQASMAAQVTCCGCKRIDRTCP